MTRDIFFISDHHFQHANILSFKDNDGNLPRGDKFSSVEEMDEYMIDRWNSVVKQGDIVYHLGDVFFGDKQEFRKKFNRLAGKKRLVAGNHDDIKWIAKSEMFSKILIFRMLPDYGLIATHVPIHQDSLKMKDLTNVHGHYHHNPSPPGPYKCVSVEQVDYTPVSIKELRTR